MTEAAASIQGKKLAARYTLIEKLGAGGQGEVWRAHDGTRGVDIALKVLNPALVRDEVAWRSLEHEHAIASLLDHPSILKVFPPERSGDVIVLPMELASGGDLRRLRGAGFLEVIPVLLEIAQALEHAHDRGVVHRDLKPGNVLFDARGRARLADFGVAETAATGAQGEVPGEAARDSSPHGLSPFTASPAQLRGEPPKPADDVYGLGALAYELLSGYPPYYPHFDRKRAIEDPVPDLVPTRQIPPLLGALIMRMLAKDPAQRPRSMREVIDELDTALNDTLTYDFDGIAEPGSTARAEAVTASALASGILLPTALSSSNQTIESPPMFRSPEPAANMPEGPPRVPEWTPGAGLERRAMPDRRARRTSFLPAPEMRTSRPDSPVSSGADSKGERGADRRDPLRDSSGEVGRRDSGGERRDSARAPLRQHASSRDPGTEERAPTSDPSTERRVSTRDQSMEERGSTPTVEQRVRRAPETDERIRPESSVRAARTNSTNPASDRTSGVDISVPASPRRSDPSIESALTVATHRHWPAVPWDNLPRLPRLEPIRARRWPWVVLGLMAGGAAAAYFWLPRLDAQDLPPDVTSLIAPIQAAVTHNRLPAGQPQTPAGAASSTAPAAAAQANVAPTNASNDTAATGGNEASQASNAAATTPASPAPPAKAAPAAPAASENRFRTMRQSFDNRLAMLEGRGAGVWGGREFALAKTRAAEAVGARDAGNLRMAQERLSSASRLLDSVEAKAPQALVAQITEGEKALGTGQQEVAGQAFDLARRIDPTDRRASDGQRRAQNLNGVLPLLADAQNAEAARDYARAAQDYSQALSLDPGNVTARQGQARANAAFGDDSYAKAVGSGFAALGAGRLDEARQSFVRARALKPNGQEAAEGLRRVGAALAASGLASIRQRAAGLEAQERWDEAEQAYEAVLKADPSLAFAQAGRARAASRSELSERLQQLIDRPERLASPAVQEDARSLLQTAEAQSPSGPVLRSQIARLEILLPGFDKPVRLSLLSDNSTEVAISSIGSFGSFSRRDIQLRPGKYTVVGTRSGFREVRREITVAPGQDTQTIRVSCSQPI